jgi:ribonuclease E
VARQLRLRDLAGLIVVDFIDMEENRNNRAVERRLKEALKNDRARIQVGRISHFGLLEMSRQRMRTGVLEGSSVICPHCSGAGTVRSTASISLHILRAIEDSLVRSAQHNLIVRTRSTVALYMLNQKRAHLREIEERYGVTLTIEVDDSLVGSTYHALERGELAAPAPVPMRQGLVRIDSLAPPVDSDEEDEPEALEASDASEGEIEAEADGENGDEERADADGENGKRRRRRRRRRGRERDASGVDPDAPQPSDEGLAKMALIEGDLPPFGASATDAPGPDLPALDLPTASDGEVDEREAEREGEMAIAREPGESDGERDGRRRRRTRRPRRERPAQDDHASQSGFRSPYGSWVRSSETGEPEYDARTEPVDLTAFGAAAPDQSAQAGPADATPAAQASPDSPAQASAPEFAETAPQQAAETRQEQQAEPHVERQPELPAAPASEPPAREAEPAPTASAAQAQTPAEPAAQPAAAPEPPPARVVDPLPEAAPPAQKRSGWWQRAKAQITGE